MRPRRCWCGPGRRFVAHIPNPEGRAIMADPFDVLRTPIAAVDPDPVFADRLRARIERALELPRGVAVSTSVVSPVVGQQLGAAVPRLTVANGRSAIDWYVRVFDASLV